MDGGAAAGAEVEEVEMETKLPGHVGSQSTKHLGAGLSSGLKSMVGGVAAGAAALVALPAVGAKDGGASGFAQGLAAGVVAAVALPVVGVASAVGSIGGGLLNTPEAMVAVSQGKEWDAATGTWILYDLKADEARYLSAEAEACLRDHVERRRAARAARRKEKDAKQRDDDGAAAAEGSEASRGAEVKDRALYDALGVAPGASDAAVKKAYYKRALRCHPDKHPGDEAKKREFQAVSAAYAVLGEPEARRRYDATGEAGDADKGGMDPAVFFAMIFGSEGFEKYVGELPMAALVKGGDGDDGPPDAAELDFAQRKRAVKLATTLVDELAPLVDGDEDAAAFKARCAAAAAPLVATPFGATLTRVIARAYVASCNAYLGGSWSLVQGVLDGAHSAETHYQTARETVAVASCAYASSRATRHAEAAEAEAACVGGAPLAAATHACVSDKHGSWLATHFDDEKRALDHFARLSFSFASVLFERQGGDQAGWTPVRVYGTPSSCAKIKAHVAAACADAAATDLTSKALNETAARRKQGKFHGSVFEAAWRVSVLDMETTLRDASTKLFKDHGVPEATRAKRARALKALAKAFLAAADAAGHKETWQEALTNQLANGAPAAHAPPQNAPQADDARGPATPPGPAS